jgi:glycosyltransferase involved in cell wall biosynthesis
MEIPRIKVIHIIPTLHYGGAERLLAEIARFHDRERFELTVVATVALGPLVDSIQSQGVRVVSMIAHTRWSLLFLWRLTKWLRHEQPAIVHTHLFGADAYGKIAAWLASVPLIISTEHNQWYDEPQWKHFVKRLLSHFTDRIIAVSGSVAQYAQRVEGVAPAKLSVILNRIDVDRFARLQPPLLRSPLRLVSVGRLEEQKGFDLLLRACALVQHPWTLTIVGAGTELSALEALAMSLGIAEKVQFYGTTDTIETVYVEHDLFVLASRWEGLGLVVMEAMTAGRPVIASRTGGITELIIDGETGTLVDVHDTVAFARAIDRACTDHVLVRRQAVAARAYALLHFRIQDMVREYEALYLRLLAREQL